MPHLTPTMRNSLLRTCLLAIGLALPLTSCEKKRGASKPHPLPPSPLVANCETGAFGGRLTLGLAGIPRTLNPLLSMVGASDTVCRLLFASLVNIDWRTEEPGP